MTWRHRVCLPHMLPKGEMLLSLCCMKLERICRTSLDNSLCSTMKSQRMYLCLDFFRVNSHWGMENMDKHQCHWCNYVNNKLCHCWLGRIMLVLELLSNSLHKDCDSTTRFWRLMSTLSYHHSIQLDLFTQHRCPLDGCQLQTST